MSFSKTYMSDTRTRGQYFRALKTDPSASRRREIKFALPTGDVPVLRSTLNLNCRRVEHGAPTSIVRSIYFDDFRMSAYRESVDSIGRRTKVRLRWYGEDDTKAFFEIKRRLGRTMEKVRVPIVSERALTEMSYDAIHRELCAVLPPALAETLSLYDEPSLLISYTREYYESFDTLLRVTLDYDVECFDQNGLARPRLRFGQTLAGLVILEGKTPVELDGQLPDLLYPLRPTVTRSSKYVMGCDAVRVPR